jgi:hypothetical protein
MREKVLLCAVLVVFVLAVAVWLASRSEGPVLREGMTKPDVIKALGVRWPGDIPDGPASPDYQPPHFHFHFRTEVYSTEPDLLGNRNLFTVYYSNDNEANQWRVQSWEEKRLPNKYLHY